MSKFIVFRTGLFFGLMCLIGQAWAVSGTIRCGAHTISDSGRKGPGKYEVIKKCGHPSERFGNTWVYDRPGQPKKILRFNDAGQLITIDG